MKYATLAKTDPEIAESIASELDRQQNTIELIASENFTSLSVLEACGSVMTNKYAEGYPSKRYYNGCDFVDEAENLAIKRVCKLFNAAFANVQPHSGSQANQAVFLSLLEPGDVILGMSLDHGGHLTHGSSVNMSGKWFKAAFYGINEETGFIDYDKVEKKAIDVQPKLIIAGASAYSRIIDFKKFRAIADKVGALLLVDMAHIAGLIAAGVHPNPLPYADVVTSTTHKTLRGPRGGIVLTNNETIAKKINSAIFPGLQGGPLMHIIAAKAVAFKEAQSDDFKTYMHNVVDNARYLAACLVQKGYDIVSGGTDNHLFMVDLQKHTISGKAAATQLDLCGITCNKNTVPNDPRSPFVTSGIRLGTAAMTSRGFGHREFDIVAALIDESLSLLKPKQDGGSLSDDQMEREMEKGVAKIKQKVRDLCGEFPLYQES